MQPQLNLLQSLRGIEQMRDSRVLLLAASRLDMELLPPLYEQLRRIGPCERLDVVLHCRGGEVNAARRIALLLRGHSRHLSFIVPYYCQSAATILSLAADQIVAGEMAIFSPIDPQLHGGEDGDDAAATALSCMDIKRFGDMGADWFGADSQEARAQSLALLCNSVFPPTLTAFYRRTQELRQIGEELLAHQLPQQDAAARRRIVEHLMYGYHSHDYAINGDELRRLGLNVERHDLVEELAWQLSTVFQATVGGGARQSAEEPWHDALLASRDGLRLRRYRADGLLPTWTDAVALR
ncbi:hypothetical protein ACFOLJ_18135 [Rugamonas sp. CCM 8940]|uniref:SDH family Clp fold serine proteinase n=1 Tax=Rugamonas sp. CCM 8940 TaxID=2765359 RepID=UPI0018F3D2F3|nr:hypothetical protein [Rugamonas sp. CCM 8940]MBJ7313425.1 hypothetical protein [Rugamonas sp. CCM 8940]